MFVSLTTYGIKHTEKMGRRATVRNFVGDIITTAAESHKDVIEIRGELDKIATAQDDLWFFNSVVEFLSACFSLSSVYICANIVMSVYRCVSQLEPDHQSLSMAVDTCVFDQIGFIFLMCFLFTLVWQFKSTIRRYQARKMAHIHRAEDMLRHRVLVVILRLVCKVYDVAIPSNCNIDVYIGTVVDVFANTTAILAPLVALFWPNWMRFFRFTSAIGFLSKSWERIVSFFTRAYRYLLSGDYSVCQKTVALLSVFAAFGGATWYGARRVYKTNAGGPLRVVPKKKQRVFDDVPDVRAIDPSELSFVPNDPEQYSSTRTFPEHPTFNGVSVAEASIVRINGNYAATAFRVGNHLVTAIHCVGQESSCPGYGIAVFNPDDNKYYWAPLEKFFRNKSPLVGGDGIAICSLPNCDYFSTRQSTQLAVPKRTTRFAGSYRLQNIKGRPTYSFSIGPCDVEQYLLSFKSSVEPGSSGGPIINHDGSVIAVVVGHTQNTNYGLLITDEIRDFLTKGGDAPQDTSAKHTVSPSDLEFTPTPTLEESSESEDETPESSGSGQTRDPNSNETQSNVSSGTTQRGASRNRRPKKKQQGVSPPPPGEHIES